MPTLRPPLSGVSVSARTRPSGPSRAPGGRRASDCRVTSRRSPSTVARSAFSSRSGSFISQWASAAQQLGLRPAAVEAAGPQPHVIGQQLGDAALADAVEHEQRVVVGAAHHGVARARARCLEAEPAAPARRSSSGRPGPPGRSAVTGWRWPSSVTLGLEALLEHVGRSARPAGWRRAACGRGSSGVPKLGPRGSSSAPPFARIARCSRDRPRRDQAAAL